MAADSAAKQAWRASAENFVGLEVPSPAWLWVQDEHMRFTHLSDHATLLRPGATVIGKTPWEIHPNLASGDWEPLRAALRERRPFKDFQYSVILQPAERVAISLSGRPCFGARGRFRGYRGIGMDVTPLIALQRELRERGEHLRLTHAMARMLTMEWDIAEDRIAWMTDPEWLLGPLPSSGHYSLFKDMVHPEDRARFIANRDAALSSTLDHTQEYRIIRTDGEQRWIDARGTVIRGADGSAKRMVVILRDISERKRAEMLLAKRNEQLHVAHSVAGLHWVEWDIGNDIMTWSESPEPILGPRPPGGRYPLYKDMVHPDDREKFLARRDRAVSEITMDAKEYRIIRTDGSVRWVSAREKVFPGADGRPQRMVITVQDITEQERLAYLAQFDPVTGLPNRNLFRERASRAIASAQRHNRPVALLFVDLDHFKSVNDTMGHQLGDELLNEVGLRLKNCLRVDDTIARIGGDEFTIILEDVGDVDFITAIADKLLRSLNEPYVLGGRELFVSSSIGIAVYPEGGEDQDTLLKHADIAMYSAKSEGRDTFHFYDPKMSAETSERVSIESRLRRALEREEFRLVYQPIVDLDSGKIVGVEALLRWDNAELGSVPPGRFIGLAEKSGLIIPIGEWVLATACQQAMVWQRSGLPAVRLAVNLSARQFRKFEMVSVVEQALLRSGLTPRQLELEITESLLMDNPKASAKVLDQLKEMGVQISIDDFGTGYSSLSYLKNFPLHNLKIDQSFVRDIGADPNDTAIVKAIVALARTLELSVTAEGVETLPQLSFLRAQTCQHAQGYLFARPASADSVAKLLEGGPVTPQ